MLRIIVQCDAQMCRQWHFYVNIMCHVHGWDKLCYVPGYFSLPISDRRHHTSFFSNSPFTCCRSQQVSSVRVSQWADSVLTIYAALSKNAAIINSRVYFLNCSIEMNKSVLNSYVWPCKKEPCLNLLITYEQYITHTKFCSKAKATHLRVKKRNENTAHHQPQLYGGGVQDCSAHAQVAHLDR